MSRFIRWQYGAQQVTPHSYAKFPGPNHVQAHEKSDVVDSLNVNIDPYLIHSVCIGSCALHGRQVIKG